MVFIAFPRIRLNSTCNIFTTRNPASGNNNHSFRRTLMKCLYYLTSTLDSTHQISDDLHEAGINDWFLHVTSKDESGLKREHVHSGNYLEQLDILRDGGIGGLIGLAVGLLVAGLFMAMKPFGPDVDVPLYVYAVIVVVLTMFGMWEGGLTGVASKNRKIAKFQEDIDAGKYLILIYAKKEQEDVVKNMMNQKHPEARLEAVDANFYNPFTSLKRI